MREQIGYLKQLQVLDARVFRLEKELEDVPRVIARFEGMFSDSRGRASKAKSDFTALEMCIDRKQIELEEKEEKKARLMAQQNMAQSNEEYSAFQREIGREKDLISQLEDEILALMSELDQGKIDREKLGKEVEDVESRVKEEKERLLERKARIEEELAHLRTERRASAERLRIDIAVLYDRIVAAKPDRRAIAAVGDSSCTGCGMELTMQEIAMAKVLSDVMTCKHCGRILYLE